MVQNVDRLAESCIEERWYEMTATAVLLGRKWRPIVVRHLLRYGSCRFNTLKTEISGLSNKALSNTLKELERNGIVDRVVTSERPHEVEYRLTEHGEALQPVLEELEAWGEEHLDTTKDTSDVPN